MCTCVEGIAKYFLFLTNLLVFILACCVLGVTIWILVDEPSFLSVLHIADDFASGLEGIEIYTSAAVVLIVVASLVIIVTFFGCCGAIKESRCMLATYFALDVLLLIGIVVGAVLAYKGDYHTLEKPFIEALKKYDDRSNSGPDKTLVEAWDNFQQDFQCCGVESFKDWAEYNENFQADIDTGYPTRRVPESCCDPSMNPKKCANTALSIDGIRPIGCFTFVVDEINKHSVIIGSVAIGVVVSMLVNAIISIYMCTCGYYEEDTRPKRVMYRRPVG